jgi:hypothetical protein
MAYSTSYAVGLEATSPKSSGCCLKVARSEMHYPASRRRHRQVHQYPRRVVVARVLAS